jgi:hypothetical protein
MKRIFFLIVIMASAFVIGAYLCMAQGLPSPSGPKLALVINKIIFVLYEPIVLTFRITNTAELVLPGQTTATPRYGRLYAVASCDGRKEEIPGFSLDPNSSILSAPMEPGRSQELQLVFVPSEYRKLLQPGRCEIKAILDVKPNITAVSDPLMIEIVEPSGLDLDAIRYMRRKGLPAYFFEGRLTMPDGKGQSAIWAEAIANLEEFVALYSGTSYGDYASLTLGEFYYFQQQNALAISTLERLAGKDEFPRLDSVLATLAAAHARLKNTAKAKDFLEMLRSRCPNSELIKSTAEFIRTHPE